MEVGRHLDSILKVYSYVLGRGWPYIVLQLVDILLVSYVLYRLLVLVRGRFRVLYGVLVLALLLPISSILKLNTLNWLLEKTLILAPVVLAILFLPELRQAVEGFGRFGAWTGRFVTADVAIVESQTIEEIVAAAAEMSASRTGALIVIQRATPLNDIAANGVQIGAKVSAALLGAIFYEGNPLHDGAAIIHDNTILAAGCRLPLSESARLDPGMHMRHRAALGVVEERDALVVVVSEERGVISVASEGEMRRVNGPGELRDLLRKKSREQATGEIEIEKKKIFARSRQPR
jgi:diadenylate cyclase